MPVTTSGGPRSSDPPLRFAEWIADPPAVCEQGSPRPGSSGATCLRPAPQMSWPHRAGSWMSCGGRRGATGRDRPNASAAPTYSFLPASRFQASFSGGGKRRAARHDGSFPNHGFAAEVRHRGAPYRRRHADLIVRSLVQEEPDLTLPVGCVHVIPLHRATASFYTVHSESSRADEINETFLLPLIPLLRSCGLQPGISLRDEKTMSREGQTPVTAQVIAEAVPPDMASLAEMATRAGAATS